MLHDRQFDNRAVGLTTRTVGSRIPGTSGGIYDSRSERIERKAKATAGQLHSKRFHEAIRSPFVAVPIWAIVSLGLYSLGWARYLTPLRGDTLLLLVSMVLLCIILCRTISTRTELEPGEVSWGPVLFLGAYLAAAGALAGGLPALSVLGGRVYDVYGFGIPGIHVFVLCYAGYIGVRAFARFISAKRVRPLVQFFSVLGILALMGTRSAVSYLLFACLFIVWRHVRVRWWIVAVVLGVVLGFAYLFGVYGDARLALQIEQATGVSGGSGAIVNYAAATDAFIQTGLDPAWLWSYLYVTSPIANLNNAFAYSAGELCGRSCDLLGLATFELVPDAVGSRIAEGLGVEKFDKSVFLVAPDVTASTAFGPAVGYAGLVGAFCVFGATVVLAIVVIRLCRDTEVGHVAMAILFTILFFAFFANMVAYSALSLQLVFVLLRSRWRARFL